MYCLAIHYHEDHIMGILRH
ncbi:hypothetical protein An05g01790 [Aspergillus niger]|uniref:Uncharacterized protein n=2 Tax=Aspergillus niger TaxID=5061 RepID=A2QKX7_ASPNC|nr:hypothetical protein An05g01790 [Aspergillus niger]CAK96514.1 hypothetical protein An05g01790 [Aspergillus niger]